MALTRAEAAARLVVGRARWTSVPAAGEKRQRQRSGAKYAVGRTDDLVEQDLRADRAEGPGEEGSI